MLDECGFGLFHAHSGGAGPRPFRLLLRSHDGGDPFGVSDRNRYNRQTSESSDGHIAW